MRRFARLYSDLDRSTATGDKRALLIAYFRDAPAADAAWALKLLCGGKIGGAGQKIAASGELRDWIAAESGTPAWLVEDSYHQVGDLAETLALLLEESRQADDDSTLVQWIEQRLLPIANAAVELRRAVVVGAWRSLPFESRLVFNKLLTGSLRIGVSQRLVQQALAELSGIDIALLAQRMLGNWQPTTQFLRDLLSVEPLPGDQSQPFPFFLASPLESPPTSLGDIADWLLEWKWDGIRLQLIRRAGEVALWSRGEERLDGRFPELEAAAHSLPNDCVLDGELLAWDVDVDAPQPFTALQKRIQLRKPGAKTLRDIPVRMLAYDLLECDGVDLRTRPLRERRAALVALLERTGSGLIILSPAVDSAHWDEAAQLREQARDRRR